MSMERMDDVDGIIATIIADPSTMIIAWPLKVFNDGGQSACEGRNTREGLAVGLGLHLLRVHMPGWIVGPLDQTI